MIEVGCFGQRDQTVFAELTWGMVVSRDLVHQVVELLDIDPQTWCIPQPHPISVEVQPFFADRLAQINKGAPQCAMPRLLIRFRPEQGGKSIAAVGLSRDSQIGEERQRFAAFDDRSGRRRARCGGNQTDGCRAQTWQHLIAIWIVPQIRWAGYYRDEPVTLP